MPQPHFLLIAFPAQGHINPSIQFAKRLIHIGAHVTFTTSTSARRRMSKIPTAQGLSFITFSDGFDDGIKTNDDKDKYYSEFKLRGQENLRDVIARSDDEGNPVTCVVYTLALPWAMKVASEHQIPSALLWIQPATVLGIYYYYFNGYEEDIKDNQSNRLVKLPNLPALAKRDLPSFLSSSNSYPTAISVFKEQFDTLAEETVPKILVNTFDHLEPEALKSIEPYHMYAIGPLISPSFIRGKDPTDDPSFDLFQISKDYLRWLNSKPKSTVVYISFGSIAVLTKPQVDEIAGALISSRRPFLWVVRREKQNGEEEREEEKLSCVEELEEFGMIVPWCSQLEVLSHPSLGCFVTHCGWNSTLESLVAGVTVVAFPQWTDQGTNAKLIEDVWRTGVRVTANEEGLVERDEIRRCLDCVMEDGERANEVRKNAEKWKDLARDAAVEGGASARNLRAFINDLGQNL